jgi:hypothetical protein
MAKAQTKPNGEFYVAESGRDRLTTYVNSSEIDNFFEEDSDGGAYLSQETEFGTVRAFSKESDGVVHLLMDDDSLLESQEFAYGLLEEDAELRQEHQEDLEPVYDLFGEEDEFKELFKEYRKQTDRTY